MAQLRFIGLPRKWAAKFWCKTGHRASLFWSGYQGNPFVTNTTMQPRKKNDIRERAVRSGGATIKDTLGVMRYRDSWSGFDLIGPARNPIAWYVGPNTDNPCPVGANIFFLITRPDYEIPARFRSGHSP